jgi:diguanylate cyclase (GGDEF)-like protein/PAS domain S-box-containing protein
MINLIEQTTPLENFIHEFTRSDEMDDALAADADVIFASLQDAQIRDEIYSLIISKKKGAKLILLAYKAQVNQLTEEELFHIDDVWILPLTQMQIRYRFEQWQKGIKQEKDLWMARSALDTTIDTLPYMVWYKDRSGAHEKVNKCFCETVNKTMDQIKGRGHYYIWDITPDEYAAGEFICMESEHEVMDKQETCVFDEEVKIKDEMRHLKTFKSPLFDLDGSVMGTVGIATDVTQEMEYKEKLINDANTDALTGLFNRRYVAEYVEMRERDHMVIYYADLDNFKYINDEYGHYAGDYALQLAAKILKEQMPDCICARMGGDEFMVIQLGTYPIEEIEATRQRLQQALDGTYAQVKELETVTASIGISHSTQVVNDVDVLIKDADADMYEQKMRKKKARR